MSRQMRIRAAIALAAAVVLTAASFVTWSPASATAPTGLEGLELARVQQANCQVLASHGTSSAQRSRGRQCAADQQVIIDALLAVTPSPSPTTTTVTPSTVPPSTSPATTPAPTTEPPPVTSAPATTPPPGPQACPPFPAFPDADCTGVPSGTTLTVYDGPCTLTSAVTIERKLITCATLRPQAAGIVIRESRVIGQVRGPSCPSNLVPPVTTCPTPSFTIVDSEITAPQATATEAQGLGEANYTAIRVEITGGNRGAYCRYGVTIRDSWVHGTNIAPTPDIHASAIRQSQNCTLVHNRINCSAEDTPAGGGCSADLTGYGDFEPVGNNLIQNNLFVATPGGACAYGGSSGDDGVKPYGNQAHDIRFVDNVFQHGPPGDGGRRNCGYYFPITDFDSTRPGNLWAGNVWDSGGTVPPAN